MTDNVASLGRRVTTAVRQSWTSVQECGRRMELQRTARAYLRGDIEYPWNADPGLEAEIKRQASKNNIRTL